jgi:hypothetical protein
MVCEAHGPWESEGRHYLVVITGRIIEEVQREVKGEFDRLLDRLLEDILTKKGPHG